MPKSKKPKGKKPNKGITYYKSSKKSNNQHNQNSDLTAGEIAAPPVDSGTINFANILLSQVPTDVTVDFSNQPVPVEAIINKDNDKAKTAIVSAYTDNETERVKRQKWLLWAVVILTGIQLVFFNLIICYVVRQSFQTEILDIINNMFDILKYYIGATVVELIGMIVFVVSSTFSTSHFEAMKLLYHTEGKKH